MVISKTPYRVSFFGGGTDYPVWYRENGGAILGTTINKYCYITCRNLPPFFSHKHRIVWSKRENVHNIQDIRHPVVKAVFDFLKIIQGVEMHHVGDLPAKSGLGASSSFTVGLLHALYALQGVKTDKKRLSEEAIHIEREILKENVGSQDQVLTSFGGFNKITFSSDGTNIIEPINISSSRIKNLESHLLLVYTGITRYASVIAAQQIKNTPKKRKELSIMQQMVGEGLKILRQKDDLKEFGTLLDESWKLKRSLSDSISNPKIDELYLRAKKSGALGGKLLGAGGGGFLLLFAKPQQQMEIQKSLKKCLFVPFKFETSGTKIIFHNNETREH